MALNRLPGPGRTGFGPIRRPLGDPHFPRPSAGQSAATEAQQTAEKEEREEAEHPAPEPGVTAGRVPDQLVGVEAPEGETPQGANDNPAATASVAASPADAKAADAPGNDRESHEEAVPIEAQAPETADAEAQPLEEVTSLSRDDYSGDNLPRVISLATASQFGQTPPDPVLGAFLTTGQVAFSIGGPGVGKSLHMVTSAVCVAGGVALAGDEPNGARPVIVACAEDDLPEVARRSAAAIEAVGAEPALVATNLFILEMGGKFTLARSGEGERRMITREAERLFRLAKRRNVGLVCFDPLIEFHELAESDNGDGHFVMAAVREFARDANCACLITHHTGKPDGGRITLASARGASSFVGAARAVRAVAELGKEDIAALGLAPGEERNFFKVEDLKMSYAPRRPSPTYYERVSTTVGGLPTPKLVVRLPGFRRR